MFEDAIKTWLHECMQVKVHVLRGDEEDGHQVGKYLYLAHGFPALTDHDFLLAYSSIQGFTEAVIYWPEYECYTMIDEVAEEGDENFIHYGPWTHLIEIKFTKEGLKQLEKDHGVIGADDDLAEELFREFWNDSADKSKGVH